MSEERLTRFCGSCGKRVELSLADVMSACDKCPIVKKTDTNAGMIYQCGKYPYRLINALWYEGSRCPDNLWEVLLLPDK